MSDHTKKSNPKHHAAREPGQERPPVEPHQPFRVRELAKTLGPGLITGASDDDPSGIGTYSQAGAQLGYGIGWRIH